MDNRKKRGKRTEKERTEEKKRSAFLFSRKSRKQKRGKKKNVKEKKTAAMSAMCYTWRFDEYSLRYPWTRFFGRQLIAFWRSPGGRLPAAPWLPPWPPPQTYFFVKSFHEEYRRASINIGDRWRGWGLRKGGTERQASRQVSTRFLRQL